MDNNKVIISGTIISTQMTFSHESHGERFYSFSISINRQSGTPDVLPIIVSEWLLDCTKDYHEKYIRIKGQFRSFNQPSGTGPKLILSIFATDVEFLEYKEDENEITLDGYVCKMPTIRNTPLGRIICDMMLAVNRQYKRCDYIPCIAWGRMAQIASKFDIGDHVCITGRIQSREYKKTNADGLEETKTAYEVSVMQIN